MCLVAGGGERGAGEFWSAVCDMGRDWFLQVAVRRMCAWERPLLAAVMDVSVIVQLKFQQSFHQSKVVRVEIVQKTDPPQLQVLTGGRCPC